MTACCAGEKSRRVRGEKTDKTDKPVTLTAAATVSVARKSTKNLVFWTETPSIRASSSCTDSASIWRWSRKITAELNRMITTGNGIFEQ